MTPEDALAELLARVGANSGVAALVSESELNQWPAGAVAAMKSQELLVKASPATSGVCPGCEQQCMMPVQFVANEPRGVASAFVVCDKRSDINRVALALDTLEQWQASGEAIAALLARILDLRRSGADNLQRGRWEIGMLKGTKHASHLVLVADGRLTLSLAGHCIELADVLELKGGRFSLDRRTLRRLVDRPVAGGGDVESAEQRKNRLKVRVRAVKARGTKAFLKTVAEEEGISVSRLKQLLT